MSMLIESTALVQLTVHLINSLFHTIMLFFVYRTTQFDKTTFYLMHEKQHYYLDIFFSVESICPASDLNHDDISEMFLSSSDYDEDDDDDEDYDDNVESQNERGENEGSSNSVPSSPLRTISYESQTSTPARPLRTSSNMSNFVWSSTSRYRPFVDHSIKKMGLIKLGKRLGDILDTSMMKARQALALPGSSCDDDECQCCDPVTFGQRQWSVNYLESLLNGEGGEQSSGCSCHPHSTICRKQDNPEQRIWSDEFKETGLPSFQSLYLFLSRVPLDIIHECLRLRLQHRPKGEPSSLSVRQVNIESCLSDIVHEVPFVLFIISGVMFFFSVGFECDFLSLYWHATNVLTVSRVGSNRTDIESFKVSLYSFFWTIPNIFISPFSKLPGLEST